MSQAATKPSTTGAYQPRRKGSWIGFCREADAISILPQYQRRSGSPPPFDAGPRMHAMIGSDGARTSANAPWKPTQNWLRRPNRVSRQQSHRHHSAADLELHERPFGLGPMAAAHSTSTAVSRM